MHKACCDLARHASTLARSLAMIYSTDGPGVGVPVKFLGAMVTVTIASRLEHSHYIYKYSPTVQ